MDTEQTERVARIAQIARLNDDARQNMSCTVTATTGFRALSWGDQAKALQRVKAFKDFTAENDPYGEHDFGVIDLPGDPVFWKIDYYDNDLQSGSEDPADPVKTRRVMTIMLASEY